jgi:hypothetical protein
MSQLSSREIARIKASAVALLLNSHVAGDKLQFLHNSKVEQYYYKVPLHSDDFWFRVIFADETYMLKATHRKIAAYSMHGFTLEFNERFSGDEAYSGGGGRLEFCLNQGGLGSHFIPGMTTIISAQPNVLMAYLIFSEPWILVLCSGF